MTLSDTARAHVAQCHRKDRSEELLLELAAEMDAMMAEVNELREELLQFTADAEAARARLDLTKQTAAWTPWSQ